MIQLEIACFNPESAIIAAQAGADRIELCDGIEVGGTTPDLETTQKVLTQVPITVYVMVRPRGGDFVYTDAEFQAMKDSIADFKKLQVHGLVFGILKEDDTLDEERNRLLVALAHPIPCTFHRAFDRMSNWETALEQIIDCGFTTILTSGTKANVVDGIHELQAMQQKAADRITIMPGGGLRSSNVRQIVNTTGVHFVHSSAITDGGTVANPEEVIALKKESNA
ncbi:copper homeostasis protein CutC [Flavobacterium sp. N1719]|uniref:copper homeostasis protein CutC n=1 Tax=Flavobacterium sp. N1719 TaxID=2885633 RepID=UPI002223E410|nr:copper homeostasis protein CutC [Flavobacterium sp. N1719]